MRARFETYIECIKEHKQRKPPNKKKGVDRFDRESNAPMGDIKIRRQCQIGLERSLRQYALRGAYN